MTQPFVRPDVAQFLAYANALPGPKMHEMEPVGARMLYRATVSVADEPAGDLAVVRDVAIPGLAGDIAARIFAAQEPREPGPVMVFFHGGGFVIGDLDSHAGFCAEAARTLNMPVVAIDYRLAPEHRWPAAPDDCEAAARWIAGSPDALGLKVSSLVLCGDSAGGAMTIVTALALRDAPAAVPVIAQLPIYPVVDLTRDYPSMAMFAEGHILTRATMDWFNDAYAADLDHLRTSPLNADLAGLPPAVVMTASLDPLRDQGRAYASALARKGIKTIFREAEGNIHGFVNLRRAIPSSAGDVAGFFAAARALIAEAEATRVMAQAAGA